MTCKIRNMSVLSYAQGFTHWHYKAPAMALAALRSARAYFDTAADMLATGDICLVSASDGAAQIGFSVDHASRRVNVAWMESAAYPDRSVKVPV